MPSGKNKKALSKQTEYVTLFEDTHSPKTADVTPQEENKRIYEKVMNAAREIEFEFWEVEYECPDPGPYTPWAFGYGDDRLDPDKIWSTMQQEVKAKFEQENNKWYTPDMPKQVYEWLSWVNNYNTADDEEQAKQSDEWVWDYPHKMYLPKKYSAWTRTNRYLKRKPEYEALDHWARSRVPPKTYHANHNLIETHTSDVEIEFQYHNTDDFHELVCSYQDIKEKLPLLTNDYAHDLKVQNGTKYHISLCKDWMLDEDDQRPEWTEGGEEWIENNGKWERQVFKFFLRDRLQQLQQKWKNPTKLLIPRVRVTRGGTYELHNPANGPATSPDLAELAQFIADAYKTSKPGVHPHISFD